MERFEIAADRHGKIRTILEAAQKRFGIFGVEKTSMREIADDIKMSKAALYYYFPDKESLYKSVLLEEQSEFISEILQKMSSIGDPELLIREYAVNRISYFRKLVNLTRLKYESYSGMKPMLQHSVDSFKKKECEVVAGILEKGKMSGRFEIKDTNEMAILFLDLLKGIRLSTMNNMSSLFIGEEEYSVLLEKTIAFVDLFIRGINTKKDN